MKFSLSLYAQNLSDKFVRTLQNIPKPRKRLLSQYIRFTDRISRSPVAAFLGTKQMWHSTKGKRGLKSVRHSLSPVSNKIIRLASKHLTTPPCPLAATDVASSAQPLFFLLVRALASQSGQTTRYVLSACILLYTYHLCTTRSRRVTLARDEGQALPRSLFRLNPACTPPASCASCSNFSCNLRLQENYTISVFLLISLLSRRYINLS